MPDNSSSISTPFMDKTVHKQKRLRPAVRSAKLAAKVRRWQYVIDAIERKDPGICRQQLLQDL